MMNSTLIPSMEAVAVPGTISGTSVIADLCRRIGERLSADCNLRPSDSYSGFSFRCQIELQLRDLDSVELVAEVEAGRIDQGLPSVFLDFNSEVAAPQPVNSSLERSVDGSLPEVDPRFHTQFNLEKPTDQPPLPKPRRDFLSR